jgi:hypothetical protein
MICRDKGSHYTDAAIARRLITLGTLYDMSEDNSILTANVMNESYAVPVEP